jgi:hypothetical protein
MLTKEFAQSFRIEATWSKYLLMLSLIGGFAEASARLGNSKSYMPRALPSKLFAQEISRVAYNQSFTRTPLCTEPGSRVMFSKTSGADHNSNAVANCGYWILPFASKLSASGKPLVSVREPRMVFRRAVP